MKYSPQELAKALFLATQARSEKDAAKTVKRFIDLLRGRRQLGLLDKVAEKLPGEAAKIEEAEALHIDSARELSDAEVKAVLAEMGLDPKKTAVIRKVDPSLLGGIRLRRKGKVIDATVRGKLDRLRQGLGTGN